MSQQTRPVVPLQDIVSPASRISSSVRQIGLLLLAVLLVGTAGHQSPVQSQDQAALPEMRVPKVDDFAITGKGDAPAWNKADWTVLKKRNSADANYTSRVKMLHAPKGVYVLFDGTDELITATMTRDYDQLWTEDVYECFFWPDEKQPIYFEYELSPLGYELPILVPNLNGKIMGWLPWMYEGDRKIQKKLSATEGTLTSKGKVTGWRAEVFIPYELLKPLLNVPPAPGSRWRGNFYRMDYDHGKTSSWDWARVGPSFHEFQKYGTLIFE